MKKQFISGLFIISMLSLLFISCLYGIKGNGKVIKVERHVDAFESVSVSAGLELILIQDSVSKIVVEADDNLQDIIKTEVSNGELKIHPEKRISSASAKRIFVSFKTIRSLTASSGSEIKSKMTLKLQSLDLSVSSGADVDLDLAVSELSLDGSSGGRIKLSGSAQNLDVDGSSGVDIIASDLQAVTCNASASSGANLKVVVSEKIIAKASSGGQIKVNGNPKERNIEKSSGGDVSFK